MATAKKQMLNRHLLFLRAKLFIPADVLFPVFYFAKSHLMRKLE